MARRVPRLSESYYFQAEYWYSRNQDHSVWFYLMAAWFYEDDDNELGKPIQKENTMK